MSRRLRGLVVIAVFAIVLAYGVVHLLVAWLAIQLALGEKEDQASNSGALHYLAQQPLGGVLVLLVLLMMLLVMWLLNTCDAHATTLWSLTKTRLGGDA